MCMLDRRCVCHLCEQRVKALVNIHKAAQVHLSLLSVDNLISTKLSCWPKMRFRCHSYNKAVLTYKALNNLTPLYITELLIPTSQTHNRALRSTSNGSLAVPRSKTAIFDGSFSCTAPRLWNQLPEVTKKAPSLSCFKTQVKQFMFNE